MIVTKCVTFMCLILSILEANAGIVSSIDRCHYTDSKCLLKSANKVMPIVFDGVPEVGIPSFNPLVLNDVNGDNGDLKLKFKDMIIKNIPKCEITNVERPDKLKLEVELICPINATGLYTLDGKLFVVDIHGDGDFEIKTDKIKISVSIVLKVVEKDGQEYYKFSSFDYKYDALEKVYITFHNLFNGDKAKAEPIITILDQSWKEIINEIGRPVIKELITSVVNAIGKLFLSFRRTELELD